MQSENDVILTVRPRGRGALGGFTFETFVSRLQWSPSLRWRVVFEVPRLQKPLRCECRRGTAVRVVTKRTHTQ